MAEAAATAAGSDPSAVVAAWEAAEAERRKTMRTAGIARPDQVAGKTGMQFFEAIFSGEIPYPPIGETLDFIPIEMSPGRAVFQGRPLLKHYNPLGTVHGGWFATLLDSCVACSVHTLLPAGKAYTTAELKINIVRPLTTKVPMVRAEGQVIHMGNRMGTADGRIVGPDGKLYAHASTTCFIFDAQ